MVDRNQSLISQDNNLTLHHADVEMVQAHIIGMKTEDFVMNIAKHVAIKQFLSLFSNMVSCFYILNLNFWAIHSFISLIIHSSSVINLLWSGSQWIKSL